MRFARFLLGLLAIAAVQTFGLLVFDRFLLAIDLFLVLAVFWSLDRRGVDSLFAGSAAGLALDALTGGIFGLHGFADTFVTWAACRLRHRLVIQQPAQVGLLFALAAALQQTLLVVLRYLMLPGSELPGPGVMVVRMVTTGTVGALLFIVSGRLRTRFDLWREKRRRRLALEVDRP